MVVVSDLDIALSLCGPTDSTGCTADESDEEEEEETADEAMAGSELPAAEEDMQLNGEQSRRAVEVGRRCE